MTISDFNQTCNNYGISPVIALENDAVCAALESQDNAGVIDALENEF